MKHQIRSESFVDGGGGVIQSPSIHMTIPIGQRDIHTPRVDESEANWLQDAAMVAHKVMEDAAGKQLDYAKMLDTAEHRLEAAINDIVYGFRNEVKVFESSQVVYRNEDFVVKDAKLEQTDEYEWALTLVLRDKPGQTRTISGYTPQETGEVRVNEEPVDVARLLTNVKDRVIVMTDKIATAATKEFQKLLVKKTVAITNPQKPEPLTITVLDVTVAPGWEQDYVMTLGYVNPKNDKRTTYELTAGYDSLELVEPHPAV